MEYERRITYILGLMGGFLMFYFACAHDFYWPPLRPFIHLVLISSTCLQNFRPYKFGGWGGGSSMEGVSPDPNL